MLGLDPGPYTLAELARAYEAKTEYDGHLTAWLAAAIYNRHRGEREPVYQPADLHPFRRRGRRGRRRRGLRMTRDNVLAIGAAVIGSRQKALHL